MYARLRVVWVASTRPHIVNSPEQVAGFRFGMLTGAEARDRLKIYAGLVSVEERRTRNADVGGPIPPTGTKKKRRLILSARGPVL